MNKPEPNTTRGVPWADHNETESTPPDPRRDEYGEEDPDTNADQRAAGGSEPDPDETKDALPRGNWSGETRAVPPEE